MNHHSEFLPAETALEREMDNFNRIDSLKACEVCSSHVEGLIGEKIRIFKDTGDDFEYEKLMEIEVCTDCERLIIDNKNFYYNEKKQLEEL